jgi:hypothetical protein
MLLFLYSHPGCNCPTGFNGNHCEFIEGQEPTQAPEAVSANAAASQKGVFKQNEGLVIGLAIAWLALVAIIGTTLVRRLMRKKTGKEVDTGSGAPMPEPEAMEGGDRSISTAAVETEESFVGSPSSVNASGGNLQTVEIL